MAQLGASQDNLFQKPLFSPNDHIIFQHLDSLYRAQVALARIISYNSVNRINPSNPSSQEYILWSDFYEPFWETMLKAIIKVRKAKDSDVRDTIVNGYESSLSSGLKPLSITEYSRLLSAIGKLYDDLRYSSPEKESIESPFDCDLKMSWSL